MDLWTCGLWTEYLYHVSNRKFGSLWTCEEVWISVDVWTCGWWTEYLYDVCNRKCGPLWTCGPVGSVQIMHGGSIIKWSDVDLL